MTRKNIKKKDDYQTDDQSIVWFTCNGVRENCSDFTINNDNNPVYSQLIID